MNQYKKKRNTWPVVFVYVIWSGQLPFIWWPSFKCGTTVPITSKIRGTCANIMSQIAPVAEQVSYYSTVWPKNLESIWHTISPGMALNAFVKQWVLSLFVCDLVNQSLLENDCIVLQRFGPFNWVDSACCDKRISMKHYAFSITKTSEQWSRLNRSIQLSDTSTSFDFIILKCRCKLYT